jgi:hypothetical protein
MITMSGSSVLNPHPPELEPFLYAYVGEDARGSSVTVLSTLARLNLDPWAEAADLAALDRETAATRFGTLLSRFRDVPALEQTHGPVGRELVGLLPDRVARAAGSDQASGDGGPLTPGVVLGIVAALVVLVQMILAGAWGAGE